VPAPESYREFYEYEADVYRIDAGHEQAFVHRRTLVRRLCPELARGSARVLDLGCGDGALSADLVERSGARVTAADLAWKRARAAAERPGVGAAQASVYALPFRDDAFDLVVCTDLLEHLDEPELAMRELVRVSRRWVLVSVPWKIALEKTLCPHCGKDYWLYGHQHSFGPEGIERLARAAGARLERQEHLIPMLECRRYKWFPPLWWLIRDHFKDTGTLGALLEKEPRAARAPGSAAPAALPGEPPAPLPRRRELVRREP
jgi:SAM-dependent methyltransferase